VTTQFNLSFLRPVSPDLPYFEVEARLDERTRRYLFLSARVADPTGRTLVLAQVTCFILPQRKD
jgi:acyl-coenzyme A thioesterase PaaI-like protein